MRPTILFAIMVGVPVIVMVLVASLFIIRRGGLRDCCNCKTAAVFTPLGFSNVGRERPAASPAGGAGAQATDSIEASGPPDVENVSGELEMQPVQRPTLPGQPAHAMRMQQLPPPSARSEQLPLHLQWLQEPPPLRPKTIISPSAFRFMGGSEGQGGSEGSRPHSSDMPRDSTVGTREFKNPDRPDEVSSAGGELEMQPVQSVTLPGQPTHAMQVQQLPPPQTVAQQSAVQQDAEPNEWL